MASCSAVLVLQSRFFDDSMIIFRSVGLHKTSVPAVRSMSNCYQSLHAWPRCRGHSARTSHLEAVCLDGMATL